MPDDWNSYFCNVNDVLASIFLNLELSKIAPDRNRPELLWVWVYMKSPRENGLSSSGEFEMLCAIEDHLTAVMTHSFNAVFCGRITTDGRREFYYYAPRSEQLQMVVKNAVSEFRGYRIECGWKPDPNWMHYFKVMFPSDEDRQRIENRKVLDVLEKEGDTLQAPRDVRHWIHFRTDTDREEFLAAVTPLQYRLEFKHDSGVSQFPKGICIARFQSVQSSEIDDAVIELFRLARTHQGDYDGWETEVLSKS